MRFPRNPVWPARRRQQNRVLTPIPLGSPRVVPSGRTSCLHLAAQSGSAFTEKRPRERSAYLQMPVLQLCRRREHPTQPCCSNTSALSVEIPVRRQEQSISEPVPAARQHLFRLPAPAWYRQG